MDALSLTLHLEGPAHCTAPSFDALYSSSYSNIRSSCPRKPAAERTHSQRLLANRQRGVRCLVLDLRNRRRRSVPSCRLNPASPAPRPACVCLNSLCETGREPNPPTAVTMLHRLALHSPAHVLRRRGVTAVPATLLNVPSPAAWRRPLARVDLHMGSIHSSSN